MPFCFLLFFDFSCSKPEKPQIGKRIASPLISKPEKLEKHSSSKTKSIEFPLIQDLMLTFNDLLLDRFGSPTIV